MVRLATRGSALARAQTELAIAALRSAGIERAEVVVVRTTGDRRPNVAIADMEGEGWFTAELERALLEGSADIAVHSAKDLPSTSAGGLRIAALLIRGDVRDAVVTRDGTALAALPGGARVGTSSPRRAAFVAAINPAAEPVPIRGNVDTRLAKLDRGEVDALLVAAAGLDRLGQGGRITERLDPGVFVPAPAQGAIALQVKDGSAVEATCARASDEPTFLSVLAERTVLSEMGGGCRLPLGVWARIERDELLLTAAIAVDGTVRKVDVSESPNREGAVAAGRRAASLLQDRA
ncbi:MAG TPA: hydroxymethylbilane synthase [Candidatus Dormibacteraeota bacterium]|nr:hydroxymethylbilane synthase [Candidatus Dormibacteraeota bacterium]